jgi:hypothetical protein
VAAYESAPQESLQRRIARSVLVLISMKKIDGKPCLTEVAEVCQPLDGEFYVRTLVRFEGEVNGKRQWRLMTGSSEWMKRLSERGMDLTPGPGLQPFESPEAGGEAP